MSAVTAWASRYRIPLVVAAVIVLAIASSRIVGGLTEYRLMVPLGRWPVPGQ